MSGSPALPYDTAAAAAVWQRVAPSMPAYEAAEGLCPGGARCALPRRGDEGAVPRLIDLAASAWCCCRRCGEHAPPGIRRTLGELARQELAALRALLALHFLLTGRWYQPACAEAAEGLPGALRTLYLTEAQLSSGCAAAAEGTGDPYVRQRLAALGEEAAGRAKCAAEVVEKALTTGDNLLKW